MGTVYFVQHESGNHYALKAMNRAGLTGDDQLRRFLREIRLSKALDHPNIVRTVDAGQARDGRPYIVTEFYPRGDLRQWLQQHGPISTPLAVYWMWETAKALDYGWREHTMIHRDIKPANLLISPNGSIRVTDMGLAKRMTSDGTQLTKEGTSLGSANYASPEQALAKEDMDCRSDLYSLGATFYHLLTGGPMFDGATPAEVLMHQIKRTPTPIAASRPDLPAAFARMIHRLIAKDPNDRPRDPAAFIEEITAVANEIGVDLDTFDFERLAAVTDPSQTIADQSPSRPGGTAAAFVPTEVLPKAGMVALRREGDLTPWPGTKAWLRIWDQRSNAAWDVAVYASFPVRFGRAIDDSIDMPLRLYPVDQLKAESMKLSSVHGEFNATRDWWTVMDARSRNGTKVDGLDALSGKPMDVQATTLVQPAGVITLKCHALPRSVGNLVAIDEDVISASLSPALVALRPENRPRLAFALVREYLPIGGHDPNTSLVPPGMAAPRAGTLWWYEGCFFWQEHKGHGLKTLSPGAKWDAGELAFAIDILTNDLFM
jgi:hypothetical protein